MQKHLLLLILTMISTYFYAQSTHTICASGCDFTTIQAAINAATSGDFISIQDAVHTENSITVNKDLTICGGTPGTVVQATNTGNGNFRIFNINNGTTVTINDLVLQNGNLQSNLTGGAILNAGDLALVNCTLRNNNANRGGAIASSGNLVLIDCTINNNAVSDRGMSLASGGGIYAGGVLAMVNTTISGNTNNTGGAGDGGGVTVLAGAIVGFFHTTIANNTIGVNGEGAGFSAQTGSVLDLANNIIANNTGAEDFYNEGLLLPASNTTNIIPSCAGSCLTFITDDPALLPLADNGGCTQTHDLGASSSAINTATPLDPALTVDQRGAARSLTEPDIGAVELTASVPACIVSLLCEGILPVEYLSFEASIRDQTVVLEWVTAVEVNNEGFAVERSGDGVNWNTLDFVDGEGNTSAPTSYRYLDHFPLSGSNYYRLKQIDYDGQWEYSDLRTVDITASANHQVRIFPNPASESVTVQLPDNGMSYQLSLTNALGQLVWQDRVAKERNPRIRFSDTQLTPGIYWLKVSPIGANPGKNLTLRLQIIRP